jgi:hypothetical protein
VSNALIEEHERQTRENAARARAVAGARSTQEAFELGAAYMRGESAAEANRAAFREGVKSVSEPRPAGFTQTEIDRRVATRVAARAARRTAPATAKAAPTTATKSAGKLPPRASAAAKAPALVAGNGDIALRARAYVAAQAKLGKHVTATEAVAHVSKNL